MTHPAADPAVAAGSRVLVAGLGRSGAAAAEVLLARGVDVLAVDAATQGPVAAAAARLETAGARVLLGSDAADTLPDAVDLVVTSPGWPPTVPLLQQAAERAVPVWGEVELAWRLRGPDAAPWLVVTGTNGKTTTVRMLESMLRADGRHAVAAGNIGLPLVAVVSGGQPYDALAVELSSFQLYSVRSAQPYAAAVLNVAADHADWHGTLDAYARAKGQAYARCQVAAVHNLDDPVTGRLVRAAPLGPGCRTVGFTLGPPPSGALGVAGGMLVDRAFAADTDHTDDTDHTEMPLCPLADVQPAAPHNTANALAAAALARAAGVSATAVGVGLHRFTAEPHRMTLVGELGGVRYVDDSKATNTHAAASALAAYPSVVWVAGGLAKGAAFDDLVREHRDRLRGVVLLGQDRARIASALARHAPAIPVTEVVAPETDGMSLMDEVVRAAAALARPGDTVLLAPACASWDQFRDYGERGDRFAQAARRLAAEGWEAPR